MLAAVRSLAHTALLCLLAFATASTGCVAPGRLRAGDGSAGGRAVLPPARERNYLREGETVRLRLIRFDEWRLDPELRQITLPRPTPLTFDSTQRTPQPSLFPGVDSVVGTVAGIVVDFVKTELEKEAARHEQQFLQTTYADDFWAGPGLPRYAGFELIRGANGFPDEDSTSESGPQKNPAAFRMVFAMVYSEFDRRIFLIKPVLLRVNAAAAKVSPGWDSRRRLTIAVDLVLEAAEFDQTGHFAQTVLARAKFRHVGYSLDDAATLTAWYVPERRSWDGELKDAVAGYFRAPQVTVKARGLENDHDAVMATEQKLSEALATLRQSREALAKGLSETFAEDTREAETSVEALIAQLSQSAWYKAHSGGAFKLFVAVTESDDSRAKRTLLEIADFVGSNRDSVVEAAKRAAGGGN